MLEQYRVRRYFVPYIDTSYKLMQLKLGLSFILLTYKYISQLGLSFILLTIHANFLKLEPRMRVELGLILKIIKQ